MDNANASVSPTALTVEDVAPAYDWSSMEKAEHFVQFYESDEYIVASVSDYLAHGFSKGDICISVATDAHRGPIEARLAEAGVDLTAETEAGNYIPLDAHATLDSFMKDGMPDSAAFGTVIGDLVQTNAERGHVRIFGEMVGILMSEKQVDACARLEQLWSSICERYAVSLFCAYPLEHFSHSSGADGLMTICGHHAKVIPSESYTALDSADDRMRAIAFLQQRGKQLEAELEELRKKIAARNGL